MPGAKREQARRGKTPRFPLRLILSPALRSGMHKGWHTLKKMSKTARSNLLNAGVIVLTLGMVLFISARGGEIDDAWSTLISADIRWILAAIGSWCVFMVFEAMILHVFFLQ